MIAGIRVMKLLAVLATVGLVASACAASPGPGPTTTGGSSDGEVIRLSRQVVNAGPATILFVYTLPDGYKVNDDAPSSVAISDGASLVGFDTPNAGDITGTRLPASVPVALAEGIGTVALDVTLIYCRAEDTDLCLVDTVRYEVPLVVGPRGSSSMLVIDRSEPLPAG